MRINFLPLIVLLLFVVNASAQNSIFVSTIGDDNTGDGSIGNPYQTIKKAANESSPGDNVFVRGGTYQNSDFNDGDIWTGVPVARIQANGAPNQFITFKPYQSEQVIIEFDGLYGFFIANSSYLKIIGFIFEGIAENITLQEAEDAWGLYKDSLGVIHDLEQEMGIDYNDPNIIGTSINKPATPNIDKPIYYNGRALVANKSHHIEILENTIRNVPSAAIRSQRCDYVTIARNVVYNNTYWTTQGVGAITVSEAEVRPAGDTYTGTKISIIQNEVYENENRLISWNPFKSFVHFEIDEGTGIFLTRNNGTYNHGQMLIANNLSYKNGASGIVCHFTDDVIIDHNTVFGNGTTNHGTPGGIGVNTSDNVKLLSNISYSKTNKWALGILAEPVTNLVLDSNIVFNNNGSINVIRQTSSNPLPTGWIEIDPLFINEANNDFNLSSTSHAIDNASAQSSQSIDFFGNQRDANPDIGAIEYLSPLPVKLLYFQVEKNQNYEVILTWKTLSEYNNDIFQIERSTDLTNWSTIHTKKGNENSNIPIEYKSFDQIPIKGKTNYYRLKQFDFDGRYEYSKIESVFVPFTNDDTYTIYPNPSTGQVNIKGIVNWDNIQIDIFDFMGRKIYYYENISILKDELKLNIPNLTNGFYFIVINKTTVSKVQIVNNH